MGKEHRAAIASVVVIVAALQHGCGATARTLAQDLAWERWTSCAPRHSAISLNRIDPDGRVWVTFGSADHTSAFNAWQECMQQAALEQGRRGADAGTSPSGVGTAAQSSDDGLRAARWSVGDEWAWRYDGPAGVRVDAWRVLRIEPVAGEPHYVVAAADREVFYRVSDFAFTRETLGGRVMRASRPTAWRWVDFPLAVGKSWEMRWVDERPSDGVTAEITRRCVAEAQETVRVPAGTFPSLRIGCDDMPAGAATTVASRGSTRRAESSAEEERYREVPPPRDGTRRGATLLAAPGPGAGLDDADHTGGGTMGDLDDGSVAAGAPTATTARPVEPAVLDALWRNGIDLVVTVPCKYIARLIVETEADPRFTLLYPSREEEGLGIAAGAALGGRGAVMLVQNSGLGNMVNAYCSLNLYYGIPLCLVVTHRGDELERVPAQVPMGVRTEPLLELLGIRVVVLATPADVPRLEEELAAHRRDGASVAFLTKKTFWSPA
jgi:sulfopyruvate decarboxylase subunit alpha